MRAALRLSRCLIVLLARIAPAHARGRWREEWLAETEHAATSLRARRFGAARLALMTLGTMRDVVALRRTARLRITGVDVAAWRTADLIIGLPDEADSVPAAVVSGNYFELLGVKPALGRLMDDSRRSIRSHSPAPPRCCLPFSWPQARSPRGALRGSTRWQC